MTPFDEGRIEGALAFWEIMAQYDRIPVPSVDSVLKLPVGSTKSYLERRARAATEGET